MIPEKRAHLHVAVTTHAGMKGKNNEDRYAVSAHRVISEKAHPFSGRPSVLALIADGIGGHRAGEVAADLAVEHISQAISKSDAKDPITSLSEAITSASQAIRGQADADPTRKGMGSTCVCAWVIGTQLFAASVGDSRLYLVRENTIHQLTTDHTWVQEAIEHGVLTPELARKHPNAHIIRRYLGSKETPKPDFRLRLSPSESDEQAEANQGMSLAPGDRLLLCSDGLTDLVEDSEIQGALVSLPREEALSRMVALANERGGHDNITILVMQVPEAAPKTAGTRSLPKKQERPKRPRKRTVLFTLGIGALLTLLVVLVAGLAWYMSRPTPPTPTPTAPATLPALWTALPEAPTPEPSRTLPPTSTRPAAPTAPPATYTAWPTNTPVPPGGMTEGHQEP